MQRRVVVFAGVEKIIPPVFVISLARAAERRADMVRRLDAADVRYEIVDAVDGATLDLSQLKERIKPGLLSEKADRVADTLNSGAIGCYLSHYRVWERMVREGVECALVLEDDVEWSGDFFQVVREVVASEWHWEIVNLSTAQPSKIVKVLGVVGDNRKFGLSSRSRATAAAYLISLSGAKKLLSYCREIRGAIDALYIQWWRHGATYYYVSPSPASQTGKHPSIIEEFGEYTLPAHLAALVSLQRKKERWLRFWAVQFHRPQKRKADE